MNQLLNIDNNQSTPSIHAAYMYDLVGNQLGVNTDRYYEWDVADQLKYFKIQAGATPSLQAQYHYAARERVKKEVKDQQGNTEVTIYIDGVVEHRYKKNNTGTITDEQNVIHIMLPSPDTSGDGRSRVATIRTGDDFGDTTPAVKYNLEDHLGTSTVRLDANGDLIDREEYYPFGDSSLRTTSFKRYRYVGKELDSESGLYYYGARYYSAWTCRFVSVDPLADKYADLNPYNYASNKPINGLDIDGMQNITTEKIPPVVKETVKTSVAVQKELAKKATTGLEQTKGEVKNALKKISKNNLKPTISKGSFFKSLGLTIILSLVEETFIVASEKKTDEENHWGTIDYALNISKGKYVKNSTQPNALVDPGDLNNYVSDTTLLEDDTEIKYVYRTMAKSPLDQKPLLPDSLQLPFSKHLGARLLDLQKLRDENMPSWLLPGHLRGGMSVYLSNELILMQQHHQDALLNKDKNLVLWKISANTLLRHGLWIDLDKPNHGSVQPIIFMPESAYQYLIISTRMEWKEVIWK